MLFAPIDRAAAIRVRSTLPKPTTVLSTIGKKLMVAPSAIFDAGPRPQIMI